MNLKCSNFKSKFFVLITPYLLSCAVVLLCVFPLFKFEYSTDTYHFALHDGLSGIYGAMKYNGRLTIYFITRALEFMSVSFFCYYYVSFIMSIVFSTLSITLLYKILCKHMNKTIAFFLSAITILNPMVFELFLFIEKGFFAMAIYMSVLASKFFLNFLEGKRWYIILSYLFVTLSCFTYQPMPGVFVALVLVFIIANSPKISSFLVNTGIAITVYCFATLMNFLTMKIFDMSDRMGSGLNFANIYKYLTFGLNIPYLLLVYLAVFTILFCVVFLTYKRKNGKAFTKESVIVFLKYTFIIVGTIVTTAAPSIVTTPENVWFTLRYSYPIGMLVGTIPILYNYKCEYIQCKSQKAFYGLFRASSVIMLSISLAFMVLFHSFFFSRHISNSKDKEDALKIGEIIMEQERKTGTEIKYISIYKDSDCSNSFDGIVNLPNCNVRAIITPWCDVPHINLFNNRNFIEIKNNIQYQRYFQSKNWDEISYEQFIFVGDTLHLCTY